MDIFWKWMKVMNAYIDYFPSFFLLCLQYILLKYTSSNMYNRYIYIYIYIYIRVIYIYIQYI
jgi:hypothetical protein